MVTSAQCRPHRRQEDSAPCRLAALLPLMVQASTKYQTVLNLKTARTLGVEVPPMLLVRDAEVIEGRRRASWRKLEARGQMLSTINSTNPTPTNSTASATGSYSSQCR